MGDIIPNFEELLEYHQENYHLKVFENKEKDSGEKSSPKLLFAEVMWKNIVSSDSSIIYGRYLQIKARQEEDILVPFLALSSMINRKMKGPKVEVVYASDKNKYVLLERNPEEIKESIDESPALAPSLENSPGANSREAISPRFRLMHQENSSIDNYFECSDDLEMSIRSNGKRKKNADLIMGNIPLILFFLYQIFEKKILL